MSGSKKQFCISQKKAILYYLQCICLAVQGTNKRIIQTRKSNIKTATQQDQKVATRDLLMLTQNMRVSLKENSQLFWL